MSKIWSLIESLQIISLMRLYKTKTPGCVNSFSEYFDTVTSIEVFPSEDYVQEMYYIPEQEPYSLNF